MLALTASTSRNWSESAPGTTPDRQVLPPSTVLRKVPLAPLAQTICSFTGLTEINRLVVPLTCWVSVGPGDIEPGIAIRPSAKTSQRSMGLSGQIRDQSQLSD